MLKVNNLTFRYPGAVRRFRKQGGTPGSIDCIHDLSVDFEPGHIYGLFGSNGVGKSTLLYLMAGLLTPLAGDVTLYGVDTRRRLPDTLRSMFLVPEELTLPELTLQQFVKAHAPLYPNFSLEDMHRHLATFDIPADTPAKLTQLSMGQRKKVFMSFALACNTPVVMMDEPTNGLDIPGKAAFRRFIASAADESRTIIVSTHQAHDIEALVDHVTIMGPGATLLLNASVEEISRHLAFVLTNDADVLSRALFTSPVVGGFAAVVPNDGTFDTEINLETLFETVVTKPSLVEAIFRSNATPQA